MGGRLPIPAGGSVNPDALAVALAVSHGLDDDARPVVSPAMARTAKRYAVIAARGVWRDAVTAPHAVPVDELGQVGRNARTFALDCRGLALLCLLRALSHALPFVRDAPPVRR